MNSKNFQPATAFELLTEIRKGGETALYILKDIEDALRNDSCIYGIQKRESIVRLISLVTNSKDVSVLDATLNCIRAMRPEEQERFKVKLQQLYSSSSGLLRFEIWRTLNMAGSGVKPERRVTPCLVRARAVAFA